MNYRSLLLNLALVVAPVFSSQLRAAETGPIAKEFSIPMKKGAAPMHASLVWENSALQAIEISTKAGGPVVQRIKVGETETVSCDLDQANLPPDWIGTLDHNQDGFQDIYLQTAQGSDAPYAVLLYDAKKKQFVASKALAEVRGLKVAGSGKVEGATASSARTLEQSFGVVTKASNERAKVSLAGPALKKGDALHVIAHGDTQRVIDAEIIEPAESSGEDGVAVYTIEFITSYSERIPEEEPLLGIAVLGATKGVTTSGGKATAQLSNAPGNKRVSFRTCTSGEGIHLTAWSGKPLSGKRIWHAYHSLGYDVEPNCTPKDYPED